MATTTNLVPTIQSTALPTMPAREWAESTHNKVLETQKPSSPLHTPDLRIPGSFLEEPEPGAGSSGGETLFDTAKRYLPAQDDVQRALTHAGQAAKGYLPQSVASYLPSSSSSDTELTPPRPPFATRTSDTGSALSNLSTQAQAGSLPPLGDSQSTLSAAADKYNDTDTVSTNLSTRVHTGRSASPHRVAPLSRPTTPSRFVEDLSSVTPPAHASSLENDFAAPAAVDRSKGLPALPNSKAPTTDSDVHASPPPSPDSDSAGGGHANAHTHKSKKPKLVQRLKDKMHIGHRDHDHDASA
ncbi:hypothetical protein B0H13DRAFT_792423 [Mycena leptocephala]|nr:hypothetical protein B0H13DRAFT_792423 [Mycena leptocephala]